MRHRVSGLPFAPLLLTCGLLASCSLKSNTAAHTVDWYLVHAADRQATLQRCANDPGTLANTPDCVNATAAAQRADIGSLRNLPPLGLGRGEMSKPDGRVRPEH